MCSASSLSVSCHVIWATDPWNSTAKSSVDATRCPSYTLLDKSATSTVLFLRKESAPESTADITSLVLKESASFVPLKEMSPLLLLLRNESVDLRNEPVPLLEL